MAISDPDSPAVDGSDSPDGGHGPDDACDTASDDGPDSSPDDACDALPDGGTATLPGGTETAWYRRYLREQSVHAVVVAALLVYPAIHFGATLLPGPLGATFTALLPNVETMVGVLYFGLFAVSFDFISGYTGYLSFGHAAFYGTGAYLVVLVANGKLAATLPLVGTVLAPGTSFVLLLLLAGVLSGLLAFLIGVVSFRLSGVYFAMVTLGFSQVIYVFVRNWDFVGNNPRDGVAVIERDTGFEIGIPGVDGVAIGELAGDEIALLGLELGKTAVSYYAVGAVVLVCYFAMQRLVHSPFGRVMVAIRENEERTRAIGYDTFRYKLAAFTISGFFAGIAGGLFAGFRRSVTPENGFFFLVTGDALLASIIGGFGTLAGPIYGRLLDEGIREFLAKRGGGGGLLPLLRRYLGEGVLGTELVGGVTVDRAIETFLNGHADLYVGVIFVAFVLYVPNGLLGTVRDRFGGTLAKTVPDAVRRWRDER